MNLGRTGFVGRFKPLHLGGARALDALCAVSSHVVIGVGSANRSLSAANPFTADESEAMLRAYLRGRHDNYTIVRVDDFGHDPQYRDGARWRDEIQKRFGTLDWFVTGNPYVRDLLSPIYHVTHPAFLLPPAQRIDIRATDIRLRMARGEPWAHLVPDAVATHIRDKGLLARIERYAPAIIAAGKDAGNPDDERRRVVEG